MRTMGEIIAQRRKEKGWTQAQLGEKMNVTDKAVSKWERNLSCPDVGSLSALAEALEMPVGDLLDAKNSAAPQRGFREAVGLILKAVPLAMGVAVTVLSILGEIDPGTGFTLTGIGLVCIGIGALNDSKN